MAYLGLGLNYRYNFRFKSTLPKSRPDIKMAAILKISKYFRYRFILTSDMERPSEINPPKLLLMLMTSLITSQRDVKFGWIQEMDTYSAYMSKSQYMPSYWLSNKSNINIIYNISVGTITIIMSVILANFGKYAISDCPFSLSVCLYGNFTKSQERLSQSSPNIITSKH